MPKRDPAFPDDLIDTKTAVCFQHTAVLLNTGDGSLCSLGSHVPRGFFAPQPGENLTTSLTWDILYGDGVVIGAAQNGQTTSYTYGLERISAKTGSTRTEYVYDGRGSVAAEVSYNNAWYTFGGGLARKNVVSKSYSPFGELLTEQKSGFGYNGEYYNAATGMIYLRARFYEPEMNRFSQKDILRGRITDPLSLNRYPYCTNDPIDFCDPSGMAIVRNTMVQMSDGGGSGKTSSTNKNSGNKPGVYNNSYEEYNEQKRKAVTPDPQEYAMLRQTGYSRSFSQYASDKFHTQFPSYPEYMQGRAMGNPYYVTYNNGKPTPVAYQRTFYSNSQSNNATSSISRDAPEVYNVTGGQEYSCGGVATTVGTTSSFLYGLINSINESVWIKEAAQLIDQAADWMEKGSVNAPVTQNLEQAAQYGSLARRAFSLSKAASVAGLIVDFVYQLATNESKTEAVVKTSAHFIIGYGVAYGVGALAVSLAAPVAGIAILGGIIVTAALSYGTDKLIDRIEERTGVYSKIDNAISDFFNWG